MEKGSSGETLGLHSEGHCVGKLTESEEISNYNPGPGKPSTRRNSSGGCNGVSARLQVRHLVSLLWALTNSQGYGSPYEDTSTLVLTAPSGIFVDVRFALTGNPTTDPAFWGFAGQSTTTFPPSGPVSMPYMAHGRWDHSIDNKGSGISDEGDMFLLPNGDCMEVGQMANPQGKIELYKEYWTGA